MCVRFIEVGKKLITNYLLVSNTFLAFLASWNSVTNRVPDEGFLETQKIPHLLKRLYWWGPAVIGFSAQRLGSNQVLIFHDVFINCSTITPPKTIVLIYMKKCDICKTLAFYAIIGLIKLTMEIHQLQTAQRHVLWADLHVTTMTIMTLLRCILQHVV